MKSIIFIASKNMKMSLKNNLKNSMFVTLTNIIYHIITKQAWLQNLQLPAIRHESLDLEGFIHCCYAEQIDFIIANYFKNEMEVFIIGIQVSKLDHEVKVEASSNGELFPHIYGPINRSAIDNWEIRNKK
jgi:uncharacterized protein (DUF952 family)